jgi:hypothetical protein
MLSKAQEKELVNFCERFKKSDDDVGLPQFLDLINSTIANKESQEWKVWTGYADTLNEAWRMIYKEGAKIPWPSVSYLKMTLDKIYSQILLASRR